MKNRISFALKDSILQQGFEIICKNLAEFENENVELKNQVYKAKDIIRDLLSCLYSVEYDRVSDLERAEQFLKEVEK